MFSSDNDIDSDLGCSCLPLVSSTVDLYDMDPEHRTMPSRAMAIDFSLFRLGCNHRCCRSVDFGNPFGTTITVFVVFRRYDAISPSISHCTNR